MEGRLIGRRGETKAAAQPVSRGGGLVPDDVVRQVTGSVVDAGAAPDVAEQQRSTSGA
jgi:hypothetical protein